MVIQVSIASAPLPPYPQRQSYRVKRQTVEFQSHLRLFHPIHKTKSVELEQLERMFQSHLRLFHPIHSGCTRGISLSPRVSIASAPLPPYTPIYKNLLKVIQFQSHLLLIHPIHTIFHILQRCGFNRICASSTLSMRIVYFHNMPHNLFQSHLRIFLPIHTRDSPNLNKKLRV